MRPHAPQPDCPRTDAVLAIYLDGDLDAEAPRASGFEFACEESLRDHLLDCATCRRQLQRARRLDAVLAASAGRNLARDEDLAALGRRWLAAVDAARAARSSTLPSDRPLATAWGRRRPHRTALVLALAASLAGWLLLVASAPMRPAETPVAGIGPDPTCAEAAGVARHEEPPAIPVAADAALRLAARATEAPLQEAFPEAMLRARLADRAIAAAERLAAARALVAAARTSLTDGERLHAVLVDILAGCGDRTASDRRLHRDLLDLVRDEPRFLAHLHGVLLRLEMRRTPASRGDLATLTVAARVGAGRLDAAILRSVRRHASLAEPLAAALRCGARSQGAAALLLDAWQTSSASAALDDDELAAERWFSGQPSAVFGELQEELRTTRSAPRRIQCLLALGCCPDDGPLALLLDRVQRAPHLEAHAAAFALSRLPRHVLWPLLDRAARLDDACLLRAALARAGLPETAAWTAALSLTPAERSLLREAPFARFPQVASWFRDRPVAVAD